MRQTAADGAAVTDCKMCDVRHRVRQHWKVLRDDRRGFNLVVPRQRADFHDLASVLDESKPGNTVDIDENRWAEEPEIQHWHEALPAGKYFCLAASLRERCDRLVDAVGDHVFERCRLHDCERPRIVPRLMTFIIRLCRLSSSQGAACLRCSGARGGDGSGCEFAPPRAGAPPCATITRQARARYP